MFLGKTAIQLPELLTRMIITNYCFVGEVENELASVPITQGSIFAVIQSTVATKKLFGQLKLDEFSWTPLFLIKFSCEFSSF